MSFCVCEIVLWNIPFNLAGMMMAMPWKTGHVKTLIAKKVHGANIGPILGLQDPGGPMLASWTWLPGMYVLKMY